MRRWALVLVVGVVASIALGVTSPGAAVRPWPCYDPTGGDLCLPPPCPVYENQTYGEICLPYPPYPCPYTDCCPPSTGFYCPDPAEMIAVQSPPCPDPEYPCDPPPYDPCVYVAARTICVAMPCPTQSVATAVCIPDPCRLLDNCIPDPCKFGCCPPEDYCY
jgi:hypothetical protein